MSHPLAFFPIHARTPSRFCDSPSHGRAFCQSGILITCRTSFLLSCDNDASLHHHPSSCRSETNERTTPTSVFNAFIARKFSKRQACGRTVVSTARFVCASGLQIEVFMPSVSCSEWAFSDCEQKV